MRIGIDISQICYEGTGVARYVRELVTSLVEKGSSHNFVLFGSSLRKGNVIRSFYKSLNTYPNVSLTYIPLPPTVLEFLWNTLHIVPVEWFTGPIDVFWSSDWTQPPLEHSVGVTTIFDMITYRFPQEMDKKIVAVQRRRLSRVTEECSAIFCDSKATAEDVHTLLNIPKEKLSVVYPGAPIYL